MHPLRLGIIELLGAFGGATAAQCARRLGTSQASCSFHLRQLAKYGIVTEGEQSRDARERPWRLAELEQSWSSEAGPAGDNSVASSSTRGAAHARLDRAKARGVRALARCWTPWRDDVAADPERARPCRRRAARGSRPVRRASRKADGVAAGARPVRLLLSAIPLPQDGKAAEKPTRGVN